MLKQHLRALCLSSLLVFSLSGCTLTIDGNDYKQQAPEFNVVAFFSGDVKAWGIVQNRSAEVVQRFIVDIDGTVEDGVLVLDETFTYIVGEGVQKRVWRLTPQADGTFVGNAGDINGDALGTPYGSAFNFVYEMDLTVDGSTYTVSFDDWFFALDDQTMMNRSYIKKFGIVVAEVTIFMQKTSS
ncbi:DUF3833 domain-containing protein [Opacimonas viscosa]|uniref:DUF3833 domain-containing protein n=1 Tax=Opacimonas viscosa TaxID=2961944 RepID=A0AA41X135_9ALTE|nr:DUF3833 domain-containing protein [Opacimonas viscosa]MCP3427922.1 DUF3833 domain-containing protein [Opacimonas viscosa]